jgi:hypothetical protein
VAIDLVFDVMGEKRTGRTYEEYLDIARRTPPLKVLLPQINARLREWHEAAGHLLPQICRFGIGDQRIVYEPYPRKISAETLRLALTRAGMRQPRRRPQGK